MRCAGHKIWGLLLASESLEPKWLQARTSNFLRGIGTRLRNAFKCAGVPEPLLIHQVPPKILKLHLEELYIYFKGGFHPAGFHRAGFINLIMYSCAWVSFK